ncbi:MAG: hypothetical protein R6T99_08260 [Bacteroidales bacterium]
MKFINTCLLIFLPSALMLTSCKKDNEEMDYNPNLITAKNQVRGQDVFTDVFLYLFRASQDTALINNGSAVIDEALVTYIASPSEMIVVDYGDYFKLCSDGLVRKGSYTASLTRPLIDSASVATIRFYGFYVQDMSVSGKQVLANQGHITGGKLTFESVVDSGLIIVMDTISPGRFRWGCQQTLYLEEGQETPAEPGDDIFFVEGNSRGVAANGHAFSTSVIQPLVATYECLLMQSGIQNIQTPSLEVTTGTLDYIENDSCTLKVDFYYNGNRFYHKFFNEYLNERQ